MARVLSRELNTFTCATVCHQQQQWATVTIILLLHFCEDCTVVTTTLLIHTVTTTLCTAAADSLREYSSSVHRVVVYIAAAVGDSDVMCSEFQAFLWRVTAASNCHALQVLEHSA
eukprot:6458-Heterococcus_DN1.PRE.2